MTRQKSDAQLDAEAAGRTERSLRQAILFHRILYQVDLYIPRLAADEPPVFTDGKTGERFADPMSMLGPTLSWPLTRFITDQFGTMYPWSRSFMAMRQVLCRKTHPEHHSRKEWRGSLCSQLVAFTIRRGFSIEAASQVLDVSPDRAGRTLANALRWIEADMDQRRELQEQRQRADIGQHDWREVPHVHVPVPGLHAQECPQCMARGA